MERDLKTSTMTMKTPFLDVLPASDHTAVTHRRPPPLGALANSVCIFPSLASNSAGVPERSEEKPDSFDGKCFFPAHVRLRNLHSSAEFRNSEELRRRERRAYAASKERKEKRTTGSRSKNALTIVRRFADSFFPLSEPFAEKGTRVAIPREPRSPLCSWRASVEASAGVKFKRYGEKRTRQRLNRLRENAATPRWFY